MLVKLSSKHQMTIPKPIADAFYLKKGDFIEVERKGIKIILTPKEVIIEDKYPQDELEAAEKVLSKGLSNEEIEFKSGSEMIKHFKKRIKK